MMSSAAAFTHNSRSPAWTARLCPQDRNSRLPHTGRERSQSRRDQRDPHRELADARAKRRGHAAVKSLGYGIGTSTASRRSNAEHDHDHGDHAKPIEGNWWQSAKGRLVLISGGLIAAAYLAARLVPRHRLLCLPRRLYRRRHPGGQARAAAARSARSSPSKC